MLLKDKESGGLVEILDLENVYNPTQTTVKAKLQSGEEEQSPASYEKDNLIFPSGENLPLCWLDADYRLKVSPQ